MEYFKPLPRTFHVEIALGIVLSLLTCGIYNVYWNSQQFKAMNLLLGREEYRVGLWLLLSLLTCGLFHIYYEYKMGSDLATYMISKGVPVSPNLGLIGLAFSCLGLTVIADAVYQNELHKLVE